MPLHAENVHKRIEMSADKLLYSGNFRRAMQAGFRIPTNKIEELQDLGHCGQANVSRGRWKRRLGGHVGFAIKKWGSRNSVETVDGPDGLAKTQNEVKVLAQLNHRSLATHCACVLCLLDDVNIASVWSNSWAGALPTTPQCRRLCSSWRETGP